MLLFRIFEWLDGSTLGAFMQQSSYAFAAAEMVHLLALAALGGAILIIDLRVLGFGLQSRSAEQLTHELMPYALSSLGVSVISGFLLLAAEPMKCYYNTAFRYKMLLLATAILFFLLIQRPLLRKHGGRVAILWKGSAVLSLLLWLGVGLAGRAIGIL